MCPQRHWAMLAAVLWLAVAMVQTLPVADDKADEMSMVAAMDVQEELKPKEEPKEEPIMEEPKPKELDADTNHIQVIKMPSVEEVKEIIEELEEEIEREKEAEAEIKEEEIIKHEQIEQLEHFKEELKDETKLDPLVAMESEKDAETSKTESVKSLVDADASKTEMMKPALDADATKVEMMKPVMDADALKVEVMKPTMDVVVSKVEVLQPTLELETSKPEIIKPIIERSPRNMQMEGETSQKAEPAPQASALTDDDIDKIMKMITFPQTDEVEKMESEKTETKTETVVEPRTTAAEESTVEKTRVGRAIRSEGKGYYILAFSPVEGPLVPSYTKFDIIPIERSVDRVDDVPDIDDLEDVNQEFDEGRLLTRKQFNKYIRKMMRQIRKGTRKIQRKTRLRSAVEEEPTVENFVRKWYATNKKAKAAAATPQRSWFSWAQKAE